MLNFNEFSDQYGNLRNDFGKFWNPSDPVHLGSNGIRTLVKIVRQAVFGSGISTMSYSDALSGQGVSGVSEGHGAVQSSQPRLAAT